MSTAITDLQLLLNPVRNPVRFAMETDAMIQTPAGVANGVVVFDNPADIPLPGDTMTFAWGTNTVVFTFTTTPTLSTDIRSYSAGSVATWVETYVAPALNAHYLLSTDFEVWGPTQCGFPTTPIFVIYALVGGTAFNITFTPGGFVPATNNFTVGIDQVLNANFKLVVQLWVEDGYGSATYSKVLEEEYTPNSAQVITGDIARVLRSYLGPEYPLADMTTDVLLTDQFRRFYLKVAEKYGEPPVVVSALVLGDTRWAYLGGRSEDARITTPDWEDQVLPANIASFLSAWPNTTQAAAKSVLPTQYEFLAYLVPQGKTAGRLRADIYYTNGDSALLEVLEVINDMEEYELHLVAVGVEQQALRNIHSTKTIHYYNVYLTSGSGDVVMSERRWFRVRYDHQEHFRQLHYMNSQGGWDTMPLHGALEEALAVGRTVSSRIVTDPATHVDARDAVVVMDTLDTALQAGAAFLRADELGALKELMGSEAIVERVGTAHWPVVVLDEKMDLDRELEGLHGRTISFRHALRNTAHSA